MGAYSWSRDKGGSGGKTHVAGAPVVLPPTQVARPPGQPPPAKRARVWKREGASSTAAEGAEGHSGSDAGPLQQQAQQQQAQQQQQPPQQHQQHQPLQPLQQQQQPLQQQQQPQPPQQQQQSRPNIAAGSHGHPAPEGATRAPGAQRRLQQQKEEEELEALREKIRAKQAQLQQAAASASRAADAAERSRQKQEWRQRLEAGFAKAFAEAKAAAAAEIAAGRAPIIFADEAEVARVLACKSDYDVLKLQPGADAAAVRRRYREMAVLLHPDKCRAAGATDAFQRLVKAYTSLLQFAR